MAELKTFLFTDICGSVRLKGEMVGRSGTERDRAFVEQILAPHRLRIEHKLAEYGGRVVSTAGDGHFLVFQNTVQAALWAMEVQQSHAAQPISAPSGEAVAVRISMHVGVPQVDPSDPDNFVGKSVDYAARLNDYATGGQILVSRSVMAILDDVGLEGVRLHLHGRRLLKGIGDVEVHEILYDDRGPRSLREQPKSNSERQWTVIPTMAYAPGESRGVGGRPPSRPLKRVGNYELQELLGSGGMGDVYRARHLQFDRVRAVKVIKPELVDSGHEEIVRRFYHEIKAVGRLEHKNIVVAIDSSAPEDRIHYLVMEYLDGLGVDRLVDLHGPLSPADACEIGRQAARGLQYIHDHGLVHRDIKPSNLMLTLASPDQLAADSAPLVEGPTERAVVKILDLGLALLVEDDQDRLTRYENRAMGTGMYMSPEQWRTTSVDIRADVYSLGCTLYHLLAGAPPFYDSDLRPEKAHEKLAAPPIRSGTAPIPRKLNDVLRKMLAKRPEDRFQEPAEAAEALAPFCAGHDLPGLLRAYRSEGRATAPRGRTPTRRSVPAETWRSRARQSTAELLASRQWWLGAFLPMLLLGAFAGAAVWVLHNSSQRARDRLEQQARQNLPTVARSAARRTLSEEIASRFEILRAAADEPELGEILATLAAATADTPQWGKDHPESPLQQWLTKKYAARQEQLRAESWFVVNEQGVQVARFPFNRQSVGENYRHRDYFHGQGRDLTPAEAADVAPISSLNLSAVYQSSTSRKFKVAFTSPIRAADGQRVVGVLGMSVDLGDFQVLEGEFRGGNEVVLIDGRSDYIEGAGRRGLILHHPRHSQWSETAIPPRVPPEVLAAIDQAPSGFLPSYTDPLAPADRRFWGAYEPVVFQVSDDPQTRPTGWVVLAQHERAP
jgi:serine/threonine protein kinase/class 3 adenylate cyclase